MKQFIFVDPPHKLPIGVKNLTNPVKRYPIFYVDAETIEEAIELLKNSGCVPELYADTGGYECYIICDGEIVKTLGSGENK